MVTIHLNPKSNIPMYEQLYQHIKEDIKSGTLLPNTKLPSTRLLAENLGVSRNTVDLAYNQLVSEGYIESKPKSGYFVSIISDLTWIDKKIEYNSPNSNKIKEEYQYDFSPFAIDINNFPFYTWKKLSKEAMSEYNNHLFLLGDNQGDLDLRIEISDYLKSFRSVNCTAEQIIVGAGADYLLQLLSQILALHNKTNCIAMENPTYMRAYRIFKGFSIPVIPVTLDKNGIHITSLRNTNANITYVTPSHQYPLGVVMSINRRLELLQWAKEHSSRYIIEDDHDSEFRYKGRPIPSLQGIDSNGKVIYMGTFSRALTPAIRIGYMVLPDELYQIYKENFYYYSSTVSRVDQYILTRFIEQGYFERHLNKMRKIYKGKHDSLLQELKVFGDKIEIHGEHAGLHLVVTFHSSISEETIIRLAKNHQIKLYGLSKHFIKATIMNNEPTILFGYANLSESTMKDGIATLYQALKDIL